jgi:hypothetical protein
MVQWVSQLDGVNTSSNVSVNVRKILTDLENNIYVLGTYVNNTLAVYNIDGSIFGTFSNDPNNNVFVMKYDELGNIEWVNKIGSTGGVGGGDMFFYTDYNISMTSAYTGTATIYNSNGTTYTTLPNDGSRDIMIVRIN